MRQILVYSDSLSWGVIPLTRERLGFDQRWPGVLEQGLAEKGFQARVLEDCLNGRCTAFEDPFLPGRNGLTGLAQKIEMHSPLSLVILMLGTNDFQAIRSHTAWHAAQGIGALVRIIRGAPIEPGMTVPPILVIAPPPIGATRGSVARKFAGAQARSVGMAEEYRKVCIELHCSFMDAGAIISSSREDGVHLDADQHRILGQGLAETVAKLLTDAPTIGDSKRH